MVQGFLGLGFRFFVFGVNFFLVFFDDGHGRISPSTKVEVDPPFLQR